MSLKKPTKTLNNSQLSVLHGKVLDERSIQPNLALHHEKHPRAGGYDEQDD